MYNLSSLRSFRESLTFFLVGGSLYVLIEIAYRGFSHISMFIVGGICFILISSISEFAPFKIPIIMKMLISCILITLVELISGIIINIFLNLHVWDYSLNKFNFLGQICLKASIVWFFLSLPAIYLGDFIKSFFTK